MNCEEEKLLLKRFKQCYDFFPEGELNFVDKPDVIVKAENLKIGIELTEVFQDSYRKYSRLKQKSSDRNKFTIKLIYKLQKLVDFTFSVSIFFNDFNYIKDSQREKVLQDAYDLVKDHFVKLQNKQELMFEDITSLPKEINSILILRYDDLDESFNEQPEGGIIEEMTDIHLNSILLKKDKVLTKYESCNEYWLLIKEGNYYAGNFSKINVTIPVNSNFNKVFLFRMKTSEIIELK